MVTCDSDEHFPASPKRRDAEFLEVVVGHGEEGGQVNLLLSE
jgi:hypothetical protein